MQTVIGSIGSFYGGLSVKQCDGKYFWGISNYGDIKWEEIPASLYHALLDFELDRQSKNKRRYFSIISRKVLNVIEDKYEPMLSECGHHLSLLNLDGLDSLIERLSTEYVIQEFKCQK